MGYMSKCCVLCGGYVGALCDVVNFKSMVRLCEGNCCTLVEYRGGSFCCLTAYNTNLNIRSCRLASRIFGCPQNMFR